jgi:ankyrin repeat protein
MRGVLRDGAAHQVVKALLPAGARLEEQSGNGWTALQWAAAGGHAKVSFALLADRQKSCM